MDKLNLRWFLLALSLLATCTLGSDAEAKQKSRTYKGVIRTLTVDKAGKILKLHVWMNNTSHKVNGCGMRMADHPELLWAFDKRRTVFVNTDRRGCFLRADVSN